jgi:hypothetical protein
MILPDRGRLARIKVMSGRDARGPARRYSAPTDFR